MFQFLSIMIFFASVLYGAWYFFGDTENKAPTSPLSYEEFLQEAIERNTKTYDVVFRRADFESGDIKTSQISSDNSLVESKIINIEPDVNDDQMVSGRSNISNETRNNSGDTLSSQTGNFGAPSIEEPGSGGPVNCDGGLLYDPCLVVGDPVPASGDMYFGSNKRF